MIGFIKSYSDFSFFLFSFISFPIINWSQSNLNNQLSFIFLPIFSNLTHFMFFSLSNNFINRAIIKFIFMINALSRGPSEASLSFLDPA
jgi:hypothetical protein